MSGISREFHFLGEHLDLRSATGSPDARWERYQYDHLNLTSQFAIARKSRQVGWSWMVAAESVARGVLSPRSTSIFVSINLDEAKEKIRYANAVIEALERQVKPRKVIDNQLEIEFQNGSRIVSHPSKPVRGKARATVYLDEFAHYPNAGEIYTSAVPVTTRGGIIRIGSSPMGAGGKFYEIYSQTIQEYPGYKRQFIPWWTVKDFCQDVSEARQRAPSITTEERVHEFGTSRIVAIFENMDLLDFQQEYECEWIDESIAWIPWEIIKRNQGMAQRGNLHYRMAGSVEAALDAVDEIAELIQDKQIEKALAGGMDIGRKRNLSEIVLVGKPPHTDQRPYRLGISLENTEFADQEAVISKIIDTLPITQFLIDQNGLGMQLAENMTKRFRSKVQGVDFTNASKELWAVELKVQMEDANIPLPIDRDLGYQIHSIKRKVTAAKNVQFDTEGSSRHHADKFWALALAVWASGGKSRKVAGARSH